MIRLAPLAIALGLVLYLLRGFVPPDTLPARGAPGLPVQAGDLTPAFATSTRAATVALWDQGVPPFWNPFIDAGAPLFETPVAGAFSLATMLAGILPLEMAVNWSLLVHVLAGMLGVFALARTLHIASPAAAATGALSFGLGGFFLDHLRVGHLNQIYPMALMPWVLLAFWKSLDAPEVAHRWPMAAGFVVGIQILEGGDSPVLYEALALPLIIPSAIFGPNRRQYLRRVVGAGAIVGAAAFAVSAIQLVPMASYVALTHRAGGLPLAAAKTHFAEVLRPIPGPAYFVVVALGVARFWFVRERRALMWLALAGGLGFAVAYSDTVFSLLWRSVPGFKYQRIPQRALVLAGVVGPVFIAAGIQAPQALLSRWRRMRPVGIALSAALVVWLAHEMWRRAPQMPPMASPAREISANHAMQWLAGHSGGARVHIWETVNRHWGTEHVTMPLGLEVITGYTASDHADYMEDDFDSTRRDFIRASYAQPAKLWGMLSVRHVLSQEQRAAEGLRLSMVVPRCPEEICQPPKSAGPYIYENARWLPRSWHVRRAIAVIGEPRAAFEAALDILLLPAFDPATVVVLQEGPGTQTPSHVDLIITADRAVPGLPRWGEPAAVAAVERVIASAAAPPIPARFSRPNVNSIDVHAEDDGWLVVGERIGLFPGWSARIAGATAAPIIRADAVLGAVYVRRGDQVVLRYRPPGFFVGAGIFACAVALWLVAELKGQKRQS